MLLITCTTSLANGTTQSHIFILEKACKIYDFTHRDMHTYILMSHMHIYTHA